MQIAISCSPRRKCAFHLGVFVLFVGLPLSVSAQEIPCEIAEGLASRISQRSLTALNKGSSSAAYETSRVFWDVADLAKSCAKVTMYADKLVKEKLGQDAKAPITHDSGGAGSAVDLSRLPQSCAFGCTIVVKRTKANIAGSEAPGRFYELEPDPNKTGGVTWRKLTPKTLYIDPESNSFKLQQFNNLYNNGYKASPPLPTLPK